MTYFEGGGWAMKFFRRLSSSIIFGGWFFFTSIYAVAQTPIKHCFHQVLTIGCANDPSLGIEEQHKILTDLLRTPELRALPILLDERGYIGDNWAKRLEKQRALPNPGSYYRTLSFLALAARNLRMKTEIRVKEVNRGILGAEIAAGFLSAGAIIASLTTIIPPHFHGPCIAAACSSGALGSGAAAGTAGLLVNRLEKIIEATRLLQEQAYRIMGMLPSPDLNKKDS